MLTQLREGEEQTLVAKLVAPRQRAILLRSTDKLAWPRVKTAEPVEVTGVYFPDCSRAADRLLHDESGTVTTVILLEPGTYYLPVEPGEPDAVGSFTLHLEFVPEFIWL